MKSNCYQYKIDKKIKLATNIIFINYEFNIQESLIKRDFKLINGTTNNLKHI